MKRIFLVGNLFISFRSRILLLFLSSSPKYSFFYLDPRYNNLKSKKNFNRFFFNFLKIIDKIYSLYKLILCDIVYILPMGSLRLFYLKLAKILKKTIIVEFYVSMYDTFVNDRKVVKPNSNKAKKLLKLDQRLIDYADIIIFLNNSERSYYMDLLNRRNIEKKSFLIPLVTGSKQKAHLPFWNNVRESIILCWWGTFIPLHGLEKIIQSAIYLKESKLDFKMYILGTSEEKSKPYREMVKKLNLDGYVIINNNLHFSDGTLEKFLAENCDIAFGNFGESEKAKTVMVNKIVEAAAMGIPVITQQTKALTEFFEDYKNIVFSESSPESIAEKIIEVSKNKKLMLNIAKEAYNLYEKRFNKKAYINNIIKILEHQ